MSLTTRQCSYLTTQDGRITISVDLITEITWLPDMAIVTLCDGAKHDLKGPDFEALKKAIGL